VTVDLKKYPDYLHPYCKKCIEENTLKKDVIEDGKVVHKTGKFCIKCTGIPKDFYKYVEHFIVGEDIWASYSEEKREYVTSLYSPTIWAKNNLHAQGGKEPFYTRSATKANIKKYDLEDGADEYQFLLMECTSLETVCRLGRRTGKTYGTAAKTLWKMFTRERLEVLLVTPMVSHLETMFSQIKDFIYNEPHLKASVVTDKGQPYPVIKLDNGSVIRGFPSGQGEKENTAIRSKACQDLIGDEADFINEATMSVALALLMDQKDVPQTLTSTPCGRRDYFYDQDMSPETKSFWFPSMVSPVWDESMERRIKKQYPTKLAYTHEVLAKYGSQEAGVFQIGYVDAARAKYRYYAGDAENPMEFGGPEPGWVYLMGVDWNPEAGVEIVMIGVKQEKSATKVRVVDAFHIEKEAFSQVKANEKIIEMNRIYNPSKIYIDDGGGGSTAIEYLHAFSFDLQNEKTAQEADVRILEIAKGINFGSQIETKDPFTGEDKKRPMKPFMVENAVRFFEQFRIEISEYDEKLVKQLEEYVIKNISPNGVPTYTVKSTNVQDHRLDALMLALLALTMESSYLGRVAEDNIGVSFVKLPHLGNFTSEEEEKKKTEDGTFMENKKQDALSAKSPTIPRSGRTSITGKRVVKSRHGSRPHRTNI